MNAQGISVFYGATNSDVALAEVRPPVGSYILVGEFLITEPLVVLDLTAFQDVVVAGSIYDENYV